MDAETIDKIAERAYEVSDNLVTNRVPWETLSEDNKDRVREVVVDVLRAMDDVGVQVRGREPVKSVSVSVAGVQRSVKDLEGTEVVWPDGVPTRVPRGVCRCPILKVGDFCPVHGG